MKARFAVLLAACAAFGAAQAQTKWDMPTPYSDGEFHTLEFDEFRPVIDAFAGELFGGGQPQSRCRAGDEHDPTFEVVVVELRPVLESGAQLVADPGEAGDHGCFDDGIEHLGDLVGGGCHGDSSRRLGR